MRTTLKSSAIKDKHTAWPELHLNEWEQTYDCLHLWMQVVGKIKLQFCPFINHWWNVAFYPSVSGISTGLIPYKKTFFELEFDFTIHQLVIKTDEDRREYVELRSGTIADFYFELKEKLKILEIEIRIWPVPVEMEDRLPFDKDYRERNYDPEYAYRYWRILIQALKAMNKFRSGFTGKASPVHFFWGSMDLAVTFFSGRPGPEHPGAPNVGKKVMEEAYNSELASFGFWGGKGLGEPAFYSYSYPAATDYKNHNVKPQEAYYNDMLGDFILPYSIVRASASPEKMILDFYKSTFKAAEELNGWDKKLYKGS